jgi:4-amino-4-deoxy-L-arabinose transferase-like glycosyltransferase
MRAISVYLVLYSVNVLLVLMFVQVLLGMTGTPFLYAPEGVVPDDARYYVYGSSIAQSWLTGETPEFPLGVKFFGYPYLLAACNYFSAAFGDMSSVSPRLLNAAAGALLPVTVYRIADLVYDDRRVARLAALLTALFPVFYYYSALLLRDIIVAYMVAVAVLLFLRTYRSRGGGPMAVNVALLAAVLAALFLIRDVSAAVPIAGFALFFFMRQPLWVKLALIAVGSVIALQLLAAIDLDAPKVVMYLTYTDRAMDVFTRIQSEDSLGMRYVIGAPFPFNIILRIPYTALIPVPPIVGTDLLKIVVGSGATIWYFLFPFWIYGMWKSRHIPESALLSIVSLLFLMGIAMISVELRHKTQFLPFAMVHVAFAIDALKDRSRHVVTGTFLVLGVLAIFYFFLRFGV